MSEAKNLPAHEENQALLAQRLRARNWAVLGVLLGFVVVIFLTTLIKVHH